MFMNQCVQLITCVLYAFTFHIYQGPTNEMVLAPTKPDLGQQEILGRAYWVCKCLIPIHKILRTPVACRSEDTQNGPAMPLLIPSELFDDQSDFFTAVATKADVTMFTWTLPHVFLSGE